MSDHPKIQLGPDNLYINDKPITDMTIEERIEQAKKVVGHENIGHKKFYIFSESELNALLRQVQDEQKKLLDLKQVIANLRSIAGECGRLDKIMKEKDISITEDFWLVEDTLLSMAYKLENAPYAYEEEG